EFVNLYSDKCYKNSLTIIRTQQHSKQLISTTTTATCRKWGSEKVVILVVLTTQPFRFSLPISQLMAKAIPVRGAKF
ncbi:hypothetical protein FPX20_16470, partial [Salmonella enterica]|nr:hypothetical protein [Salmonella enterica]